MTRFLKMASGVDVLPVLLDLHRADYLWDANQTRRTYPGTPHAAMTDIWVRFRAPDEVTGLHSHKEEYRCVNWPAWQALPSLRPLLRALKNQVDAVELGSVLITRLPPGKAILPHDDRGSWAAEYFNAKVHVGLAGSALLTCDGEQARFGQGDVWTFDNLLSHDVTNDGDVPRIVLIVSMRCDA